VSKLANAGLLKVQAGFLLGVKNQQENAVPDTVAKHWFIVKVQCATTAHTSIMHTYQPLCEDLQQPQYINLASKQ